ncbi:SET domain-containing protein [Candidatus Roizmanbacteria bacterium]|nr:SET domain-containing protein [Candidatus Roizmanbacteria bacterium]
MFLLAKNSLCIKKVGGKGFGVFSKKSIRAGMVISDYLGKVIKTAEYDLDKDREGLYLMYLTDQASIYPNLSKPGPHLINHSCTPNCWIYIYHGHTLFFALRDIDPDEELTISYLLSPDEETCKPCTHICNCGSKNCNGTFHLTKDKYEKWQKFLDKEKKKMKVAKFAVGKNLSKLPSYPKTIPQNFIYEFMNK